MVASERDAEETTPARVRARWPIFTTILACVQMCSFVLNCSLNGSDAYTCAQPSRDSDDYAHSAFDHYFAGDVWVYSRMCAEDSANSPLRLLTSGVSHYGLVHLCVCVVGLLVMGSDTEIQHGGLRVAVVWFVGLWASVLAYQLYGLTNYRHVGQLVGSSGALYGLVGSRVTNLILYIDSMSAIAMRGRLVFIVLFVVVDTAVAVLAPNPTTAYSAHAGGFLGGWLASAVVYAIPNDTLDAHASAQQQHTRHLVYKGTISAVGIVALAVVCHIVYTSPSVLCS